MFLSMSIAQLRSIDDLTHYSNLYITCSAGGDNDHCEQYRREAAKVSTAPNVFNIIFILLNSFFNFSHLIYVISFSCIKDFIQRFCKF